MHPEICQIGPFTIYSYGLMLALAFSVAAYLAGRQAKRQNINPDSIFNLAFIILVSGIIGARIFYILENLTYYLKHPWEMLMLQHGGLSWFGGLGLALICGIIYLRKRELAVYKTLDLLAPFVALAQGIGRIGCLLNGCCYGKVSKFGLYFAVHQAVLIPTQLYSSLALVAVFISLRFLQDRPHQDGQIFFLYLFLYSLQRFCIEFWRADNPVIFLGLTLFQLISAAVFLSSLFKLISLKESQK